MKAFLNREKVFIKLRLISYIGIAINFFLTVLKFVVGITGQSEALVADGFNSLADIFAGLVVYISFKISKKPQDKEHPYGHAKAEMIATFIVAIILFGFAFFVVIMSALKLYYGVLEKPEIDTLFVALATIVIKEILYLWTLKWGNLLKSTGLIATAYDHKSDVLASAAVVVGIVFARLGYTFMDPIAGLIVSLFIFRLAIKLIKESVGNLMDESPTGSIVKRIRKVIINVKGVEDITDLKVRKSGPYIYVDVNIEVDSALTVKMAHDIAETAKNDLIISNPYINDVMVHINPYDKK
ncbi:MAG: cation diffusion facilitator family transporter [Deltaproteobacteria bacterium]|nr:cation diffusion facilitator family transporter [Deltaproteobacteria bacterium]